jgi:dsDNA-specific endonuclease/ATPase MutS2
MLYPANLEQKINFVKIKELLKAECTSPLGQSYVDNISFSTDFSLVQRLLDQTEEFRQLLIAGESFPSSNFLLRHRIAINEAVQHVETRWFVSNLTSSKMSLSFSKYLL